MSKRVESLSLSEWKPIKGNLDFSQPLAWFKGDHCNPYPLNRKISIDDILLGWRPKAKLIKRDTKALAFGSCFAEYFIQFLKAHGYNKWMINEEELAPCMENLLLSLGQSFENAFVIEQQFRWAFGEFTPSSFLWFTKDKQYFEATEERRANIRENFEQVDVVVITLGLSEIWFDRIENEPMWRSIPQHLYDKDRHVFKLATVDETIAVFLRLNQLIEKYLPQLKVVFTISPIPLLATFRDQSPVTANLVSKSILKVALDAFLTNPLVKITERYYYFPSYEIVLHWFEQPFEEDYRHIKGEVATQVMEVFGVVYTDLPLTLGFINC
jgi:hypothetical protein